MIYVGYGKLRKGGLLNELMVRAECVWRRSGAYLGIDLVQLGLGIYHLNVLSWSVSSILLTAYPSMTVSVQP